MGKIKGFEGQESLHTAVGPADYLCSVTLPKTPGLATHKLGNNLVLSYIHTFRVAIYAAARKLLASIPIIPVSLRVQLTRSVTLRYSDTGSIRKSTLREFRDFRRSALESVYT
jgi:hypothetical protein